MAARTRWISATECATGSMKSVHPRFLEKARERGARMPVVTVLFSDLDAPGYLRAAILESGKGVLAFLGTTGKTKIQVGSSESCCAELGQAPKCFRAGRL